MRGHSLTPRPWEAQCKCPTSQHGTGNGEGILGEEQRLQGSLQPRDQGQVAGQLPWNSPPQLMTQEGVWPKHKAGTQITSSKFMGSLPTCSCLTFLKKKHP